MHFFQFVMSLGLPMAVAVQINGEVPGYMSVDSVCKVMAPDVGTPYSRLQNFTKMVSFSCLLVIEKSYNSE